MNKWIKKYRNNDQITNVHINTSNRNGNKQNQIKIIKKLKKNTIKHLEILSRNLISSF